MAWYLPAAVAPDLADDLVTGWVARVEGTHQLLPDGCIDVLWINNGTAWVCGPETEAWSFSLPPGTEAVGIRFRPGRAGGVFGFDTADVANRRVAVEDVLGSRAGRTLIQRVGDAADTAAALDAFTEHARRWLTQARDPDPVANAVVQLLRRDITMTVAAMADATGVSERHLHRRCRLAFGYGPAVLRRILRLQRFLRLARHLGAPVDLARLAVLAGYTDQAHLSHDSRAIAGLSPRRLVGREMSDLYTTHHEAVGQSPVYDTDR